MLVVASSVKEKLFVAAIVLLTLAQGYTFYELKIASNGSRDGEERPMFLPPDKVYPVEGVKGVVEKINPDSLVISLEGGAKTVVLTKQTIVVKSSGIPKDEETQMKEMQVFNEKMRTFKSNPPSPENPAIVILPSPFIETESSLDEIILGSQVSVLTDPSATSTPIAYKIIVTEKE